MSATPTFLLFTAIYLAVLVYIGWRGYKSTKEDVADFFTARGTVGTVVLFFTMYATTWSAWTFLGMTGAAFAHGLGWFLLVPASGALGLTMFLLAPRVHDWAMNFKYVTPSDMFEDRFGSRGLGLLIAGIGIVGVVPYAAVQIMGIGYTFESITGGDIPFLGGTFFFLLFLAVYTIFGGFRAVAWTDTIQGIIFLVFLWIGLSMVMSADDYGGIEKAYADLASRDPSPLGLPGHAGYFVHTTWISWFVLLIPGITAYPWIIQRFYSAQSKAVIYKPTFPICHPNSWNSYHFPTAKGTVSPMQPSDGMILVIGPRLEGHSVIFLAIQTHLSCRFLLAVDSLGLRRSGSSSQIINQAQDFPEQVPRHRHLSQLERNVAAMSDNLGPDLHQLVAQRRHRPVLHLLRQSQCPHEVAQIVGQGVKLEPNGIVAELAT